MDGMGICEPKSIEKWDRVEVELAFFFARDIQRFSEHIWTPEENMPKISEN